MWIVPPVAGMIEPAVAPEHFVGGIGAVEWLGSNIRIYLIAEQMPLDGGVSIPSHVVVAKIVGPVCNVPAVIGQLARCLIPAERSPGLQPERPNGPHLVR